MQEQKNNSEFPSWPPTNTSRPPPYYAAIPQQPYYGATPLPYSVPPPYGVPPPSYYGSLPPRPCSYGATPNVQSKPPPPPFSYGVPPPPYYSAYSVTPQPYYTTAVPLPYYSPPTPPNSYGAAKPNTAAQSLSYLPSLPNQEAISSTATTMAPSTANIIANDEHNADTIGDKTIVDSSI